MSNAHQQARILANIGWCGVILGDAQRAEMERQGVVATPEVIAIAAILKDFAEEPGDKK